MTATPQDPAPTLPSNTFNGLRQAVETQGGVLTTTMEQLRDIHGAGRLGVHVRKAISDQLHGNGLGHYPVELPAYYWDPIRVYALGSPINDLIGAVLHPTADHDEELRVATGGNAAEILRQVRQLVCP